MFFYTVLKLGTKAGIQIEIKAGIQIGMKVGMRKIILSYNK